MEKAHAPIPEIQVVSEDEKEEVYTPTHWGGLCVHIPEARHSSWLGPFNLYPSAQWNVHCELKEKFPRGWLQFMNMCWGRPNSPHSLTVGTKYWCFHCRLTDIVGPATSRSDLCGLLHCLSRILAQVSHLSLVSLYHLRLGKWSFFHWFFISNK